MGVEPFQLWKVNVQTVVLSSIDNYYSTRTAKVFFQKFVNLDIYNEFIILIRL